MPRKKPRFGTPLAEVESLITSLRDELATLPASIEEGSDALARVRERFQGRILAAQRLRAHIVSQEKKLELSLIDSPAWAELRDRIADVVADCETCRSKLQL